MPSRTSPRDRATGLLVGLALVAVGTLALLPARDSVSSATPALALLAPGIVAAVVGGRLAAVGTAVAAALALDLVFLRPYGALTIHVVDDVVALVTFAAVALTVATLVALANDRRRAAELRAEEVLALSRERERMRDEQARLSSEKSALVQAEEARRALLRSVSHDLRTPLAAIRAITSDLRAGAAYDEPTRDDLLDVVGDEAERLDRLVANLLGLSRIEADALVVDRQAVDLDELCTDRVRRLSRLLRDVSVVVDLPPGLPLVDADYTLVDQVVTNLLENATRHTPPQGTVRITGRPLGGGHDGDGHGDGDGDCGVDLVELAVEDAGPGVPAAERDAVFEPFRTGSSPQRSSGVGLAICKAIVEAHGGTIAVGDGPGGGARVAFTLPVHRGTHPAPPEATATAGTDARG